MSTVVPEISLISLQNQSEYDLKILKEALNTHGFFTIIDHDIDDSLLDDSYTCAKEFFDLLYPSYGDTYPTYLGAIGMTYEQAGGGVAGLGILNACLLYTSPSPRDS